MIIFMSDILCVTNRLLCKDDFLLRIDKIASYRPAGIILREKDLSDAEYKILASYVNDICKRYGTKLILHTFVKTAQELDVCAIHLPMRVLKNMSDEEKESFSVIGASCHSLNEAKEAENSGCSYITLGHIFNTDCKKGLQGRGLEFLKMICKCVSIPVYAIGGISALNAEAVRNTGTSGICVMSGVMTCDDPSEYLRSLE